MSRITRISRLRGCGVFRNFTWPPDLPDLGKYNLIYGWNGTGKTTLSRIFRDLEARRPLETGEAILQIGRVDVTGRRFPDSTLQIQVFNRDFIEQNVLPVGGGDMPPILVLGAESVEHQRRIEHLQAKRLAATNTLESTRSAKKMTDEALDQFCIARARTIKSALRAGDRSRYNNYNKRRFRNDAEKMADANDSTVHRLTDVDHRRLLARHRGTAKPRIAELEYELPESTTIMDRVHALLTTTVVSAAIDSLENDPTLSDWTLRGVKLHESMGTDRCLFCDQSLPERRLDVLKAHFNAQYDRLIQRIDQEKQCLDATREASRAVNIPPAASLYEHLAADFQSCERELKEATRSVLEFLSVAAQLLEKKRRCVFQELTLPLSPPPSDGDSVERLNAVIRRHNEECDTFESGRAEARERLAKHMIASRLHEFERLRSAASSAASDLRTRQQKVGHLDAEIGRLEREIVEHRQPAEDLNEDLRRYLGHGELCLKIRDTGYAITRGGKSARTVSEGETTAIALLYFLRSLGDRRFDMTSGVVVLDDPVSSLDANALFLAFGFVREHAGNAGQLVILTHNFAFFRQVRNWFQHLNRGKRKESRRQPAQFFMLDSSQEGDVRSSAIRRLDPLLIDCDSEYQYLFSRIYDAANASARGDLEENYVLPNMARRLLEAFLAFRYPHVSGGLWRKMREIPFDNVKKHRILRFLHTHSHGIGMGEPEHDLTALAEGPSVLGDLLDMVKAEDARHFAAMVKLVESAANTRGGGN